MKKKPKHAIDFDYNDHRYRCHFPTGKSSLWTYTVYSTRCTYTAVIENEKSLEICKRRLAKQLAARSSLSYVEAYCYVRDAEIMTALAN